jgi:ABC-type Fe3+/spermidine/putrescine transport system ATPase subunit
MEAIEAEFLTLGFAEEPLLRQSTFNIQSGEMVAILGPSGSGKTTLLRAIAGFVKPVAGRIRLCGRDVASTPPERRSVAMLFQDPALFPQMDVVQNALAAKKARGIKSEEMARVEALIGNLIDLFQMKDALNRPVRTLSGGERQRAAIIRCLINAENEDILLLDEPFKSTLNHALRWTVMRAIMEWHSNNANKTIVFVTHEFIEAAYMCARVAVISEEKTLFFGAPDTLYVSPPSLSLAAVLGPLNVLDLTPATRLILAEVLGPQPIPSGASRFACRPGSISIDTSKTGFTVAHCTYLGDYKRVRLQALSDPAVRLEADIPATAAANSGDTVGARVQRANAAFYDDNGKPV